jgi:hypothetical protein
VNTIEDRLRDAYLAAADTVNPDTIGRLDEQSVTITGPRHRPPRTRNRSWMTPVLAAAALAVIAIAATTVLPGLLRGNVASSGIGERFLGMLNRPGSRVIILNATTGARVAAIAAPGRSTTFEAAATGNGVSYAVAVGGMPRCSFRLYQFSLNSLGKPGKLTPLVTGDVNGQIDQLALSADGSTFAYFTSPCGSQGTSELHVINLVTRRSRQWPAPNGAAVRSLSLTSDGRLLAYLYSTGVPGVLGTPGTPEVAYLLRTSAGPGSLLARSRVLATGPEFGRGAAIQWAAIAGDGRTAYVATITGPALSYVSQIRAIRIATGRATTVMRGLQAAFTYAADPSVTRLIAGYEATGPNNRPQAAMISLRKRTIKILPGSWPVPLYEFYIW